MPMLLPQEHRFCCQLNDCVAVCAVIVFNTHTPGCSVLEQPTRQSRHRSTLQLQCCAVVMLQDCLLHSCCLVCGNTINNESMPGCDLQEVRGWHICALLYRGDSFMQSRHRDPLVHTGVDCVDCAAIALEGLASLGPRCQTVVHSQASQLAANCAISYLAQTSVKSQLQQLPKPKGPSL